MPFCGMWHLDLGKQNFNSMKALIYVKLSSQIKEIHRQKTKTVIERYSWVLQLYNYPLIILKKSELAVHTIDAFTQLTANK